MTPLRVCMTRLLLLPLLLAVGSSAVCRHAPDTVAGAPASFGDGTDLPAARVRS